LFHIKNNNKYTASRKILGLRYIRLRALRGSGMAYFSSRSGKPQKGAQEVAAAPTPSPPRRRFIIDCDPGVDDAIAILMAVSEAARLDEQILAVTTVHGNVPLELTTKNAMKVLDVLPVQTPHFDSRRIPIFRGCASPLIHSAHEYFPWHG